MIYTETTEVIITSNMAARKKHQNQMGQNERTNDHGTSTKLKQKSKIRKEKRDINMEGTVVGELKQFSKGYLTLVFGLALLASYLQGAHVSKLFESDRHFSHLSTLERELAFRTEMGLYYSYFKTIIDAPSFGGGVYTIMNDNITEFPSTINTLKRFNLYPEVFLGAAFRVYDAVMFSMNKATKQCWTVNRGQGLAPVESCEGLGEPSYFYVDSVFLLNGLMMGVIFLYATFLSGSIYGGILAVLCFFYNHGECTRVQWTPPLRESFAYPFLVLQMLLVTYVLRIDRPTYKHSALIAAATVCFMLPWQFAQFALLTQTVSVLGTYVLGFIGSQKMKVVLYGQTVALFISYILLFGNEMLLTSFFASCLFTVHIILLLEPIIENIKIRPVIWVVQGVILALGTIAIKMGLSSLFKIADDAHISDIFRSKFANFKNFHTMLYTCAPEFDFMQAETPVKLLHTLLLPSVLIAVAGATVTILRNEYQQWISPQVSESGGGDAARIEEEEEEDNNIYNSPAYRSKPHAEVVYNIFQLLAYTAMAVIIMRLKLFWTPHMCLLASLLASRQFFGWACSNKKTHISVLVCVMAAMSVAGISNLKQQWGIIGEFSNWPQEEMVEWIKAHTPQNAVFAGPMPTMATVKLCTGRPIVNHPHYEDAGLRARTKMVYSMYSRKPVEEVKQNLIDLHVDYAILEDSWCTRRQKPGCGMPEIWDVEDPVNQGSGEPTCTKLRRKPGPHFKRVFKNDVYEVLKIVK